MSEPNVIVMGLGNLLWRVANRTCAGPISCDRLATTGTRA